MHDVNPSSNMAVPDRNNLTAADFRRGFDKLREIESSKEGMISTLLDKFSGLEQSFKNAIYDYDREREANRRLASDKDELSRQLRMMRSITDRSSTVAVLLDGDGMIFSDELLQRGESGGKDAAGILHRTAVEYVKATLPFIPEDFTIVAKIFANLTGLAEACERGRVVETASLVHEFARGFTQGRHLFDFIDVGYGKEKADAKMRENFKLYLANIQCKQIIVGVSHDNGYATMLEEHASYSVDAGRITLLEGLPFAREIEGLRVNFSATQFPGLFRTRKIEAFRPVVPVPTPNSSFRSASNHTPSPATVPVKPAISSYAGAALTRPAAPPTPPPAEKSRSNSSIETIQRNKLGQRVDADIKADRAMTNTLRELKLCNNHFLLGYCNGGKTCKHRHEYKLSATEKNALRFVARLSPCWQGLNCDDPKCISGHKCFNGPNCKNDNCRFSDEMHHVDLNVVKTVKV